MHHGFRSRLTNNNAVLEADGGDVLIEIKPIEVGAVGAEADKASGGDVFKPIEVVAEADKASNRDAFKRIEVGAK